MTSKDLSIFNSLRPFSIGFVVVGDNKSNLDDIKKIRYVAKSKKIAPDLINSL